MNRNWFARCIIYVTCIIFKSKKPSQTILDNDFFSEIDDDCCTIFDSNFKVPINGGVDVFGPFALDSEFYILVVDNGVRVF